MNLNLGTTQKIISSARDKGLLRNQLAYVLATAYWESAHTMQPVKEAFWLSEDWRKKNLRYYPWYGRGLVQITWEDNYKKYGIKNPDDALKPDVAIHVLLDGMINGKFTGKKLSDFITLSKSNFVAARAIVNGKDKATEIAELARKYDSDLLASGYGVSDGSSTIPSIPTSPEEKPVKEPIEQKNVWLRILSILLKLLGR